MADATRDLMQQYMALIYAEYERIGIVEEMDRYFTGSGGGPVTRDQCEAELRGLRAIPSGIGFDAYCARVGMDANEIRRMDEELRRESGT